MIRVMIATPMYNSQCTAGYTISMINLVQEAAKDASIDLKMLYALNESLIPKTRSMLAHAFLKGDADYLLFIDSDLAFDGRQIIRMIKTGKDLVCGIYPKKKINWQQVRHAVINGVATENLQSAGSEYLYHPSMGKNPNEDKDELVEIEKAGTGMMLIHRRVFDTLRDQVPTFRLEDAVDNVSGKDDIFHEYFRAGTDPKTGIYLHEDFYFCHLWRQTGGKIYAPKWVQLQHIGTHIFG